MSHTRHRFCPLVAAVGGVLFSTTGSLNVGLFAGDGYEMAVSSEFPDTVWHAKSAVDTSSLLVAKLLVMKSMNVLFLAGSYASKLTASPNSSCNRLT